MSNPSLFYRICSKIRAAYGSWVSWSITILLYYQRNTRCLQISLIRKTMIDLTFIPLHTAPAIHANHFDAVSQILYHTSHYKKHRLQKQSRNASIYQREENTATITKRLHAGFWGRLFAVRYSGYNDNQTCQIWKISIKENIQPLLVYSYLVCFNRFLPVMPQETKLTGLLSSF